MAKRKLPIPQLSGSPEEALARLRSPVHPFFQAAAPGTVAAAKGAADDAKVKQEEESFNWTDKIPVLSYQYRWIMDNSILKVAVWSRQSGKSFAAALRAVLKCMETRTQYIILSKGERQSRLFMEKVKDFCQAFKQFKMLPGYTETQDTDDKTMEVVFPHNGSRIIGLPANPDTARGYTGHIVLDEFAFHGDAHKIFAACFPIITRGYSIEVISTPNGTAGKFYEIAKAAGLVGLPIGDGRLPIDDPSSDFQSSIDHRPSAGLNRQSTIANRQLWSGHKVDIHDAVRAGLPADVPLLRSACDDEETWQQEYCCQFLSDAQNYIPVELIAGCVHEEATTEWAGFGTRDAGHGKDKSLAPSPQPRELYLGVDIGRKRDMTIAWLFEKVGGVLWSRVLVTLKGVSFDEQEKTICGLIEGAGYQAPGASGNSLTPDTRHPTPAVRRVCVDQSGLGMMLAEHLVQKYGAVVEAVQFTAALKERLAPLVKQAFEERTVRIPDHRDVRADINSVKRFVTPAGNVRFDAEHTDRGHADRFWALAMVASAASAPRASFADQALLVGKPVTAGLFDAVL